MSLLGVEHSVGSGGPKPYQPHGNSENQQDILKRQTMSAKVHGQEGNSPECMERSLSREWVVKEVCSQ